MNLLPFSPPTFQSLRKAVLAHGFRSGEIILEIAPRTGQSLVDALRQFCQETGLTVEGSLHELEDLSLSEAKERICKGLSTKKCYTVIERVFLPKHQRQYADKFLSLFEGPKCFTVTGRVHQKELPDWDDWQSFGTLVIDRDRIGLFWVNDLLHMGR